MKLAHNGSEHQITFSVEIFESREWQNKYKETEESEYIMERNEHRIFIVSINRTEGDMNAFYKLKRGFLLLYCSSILKGLPKWALTMEDEQSPDDDDGNGTADDIKESEQIQETEQTVEDGNECEEPDEDEDDDYDAVLEEEVLWTEEQPENESVIVEDVSNGAE